MQPPLDRFPHAPTRFNHATAYFFADHEPGLWRAVITQALLDAACQSRKEEARRSREAALQWLLSDSQDFVTVCDHAGFDADYIRRRAKEALARGCQWRLPVGMGWRAKLRRTASPATQH